MPKISPHNRGLRQVHTCFFISLYIFSAWSFRCAACKSRCRDSISAVPYITKLITSSYTAWPKKIRSGSVVSSGQYSWKNLAAVGRSHWDASVQPIASLRCWWSILRRRAEGICINGVQSRENQREEQTIFPTDNNYQCLELTAT